MERNLTAYAEILDLEFTEDEAESGQKGISAFAYIPGDANKIKFSRLDAEDLQPGKRKSPAAKTLMGDFGAICRNNRTFAVGRETGKEYFFPVKKASINGFEVDLDSLVIEPDALVLSFRGISGRVEYIAEG